MSSQDGRVRDGMKTISLLGKFFRLPRHDRLLLLEATLALAAAGFAITVLPFRHVGRLAARPTRRSEPPEQTRLREVERTRWAIVACASRVPWRAMCFQQGLAAQFMLRRRGVPSVLYYGAAPDQRRVCPPMSGCVTGMLTLSVARTCFSFRLVGDVSATSRLPLSIVNTDSWA